MGSTQFTGPAGPDSSTVQGPVWTWGSSLGGLSPDFPVGSGPVRRSKPLIILLKRAYVLWRSNQVSISKTGEQRLFLYPATPLLGTNPSRLRSETNSLMGSHMAEDTRLTFFKSCVWLFLCCKFSVSVWMMYFTLLSLCFYISKIVLIINLPQRVVMRVN